MQLNGNYGTVYRAYAIVYDGQSYQVRAWADPLEARRMVFNNPKKQQTISLGTLVAQTTSKESAQAMLPEYVEPAANIGDTDLWLIPHVQCSVCLQCMPRDMIIGHIRHEHFACDR